MVNDHDKPLAGKLVLTLETRTGKVLAKSERTFAMDALGAGDFPITLPVPGKPRDNLVLKATAVPAPKTGVGPAMSRRRLSATD